MPAVRELRRAWRIAHRQMVPVSRVRERQNQPYPRASISALPDDVLREIFVFYLITPYQRHDAWHTLVHVSKRWRFVVFASPRRLQLRLLCTDRRPVQHTLDIWPELPIVVKGPCGTSNLPIGKKGRRGMAKLSTVRKGRRRMSKPQDNIIAALKQHNRVCEIDIADIPNTFLKEIRAMKMRNPFSALTSLQLHSPSINLPALPDSFLGGSAPRLQILTLNGIPFPALPKLLLSTPDLIILRLWNIPPSGYISPEAMVAGLSALTRLESLSLEFQSPRFQADRENRLPPHMTRVVLPSLALFIFKGNSEYLEDIIARIDTPLLDQLIITFFNQLIFATPILRHFISRTESFNASHRADVCFYDTEVYVGLYRRDGADNHCILSLVISCRPSDWQLSSLAQLCNSALSPLTTLERLEVKDYREFWEDDAENSQWVELLHPFTSVKYLVLHGKLVHLVTPALEEVAWESVTEVLPAIQNLFLEGPQPSEPDKKAIGEFVTARRLSGRPVAVYHLERGSWQQMHLEVWD